MQFGSVFTMTTGSYDTLLDAVSASRELKVGRSPLIRNSITF